LADDALTIDRTESAPVAEAEPSELLQPGSIRQAGRLR
jgi:hypothetical protein